VSAVAAAAPVFFAHAGHILTDGLTMLPVVVLAGWFLVMGIRDKRRRRDR
jgi:hypothetical protein